MNASFLGLDLGFLCGYYGNSRHGFSDGFWGFGINFGLGSDNGGRFNVFLSSNNWDINLGGFSFLDFSSTLGSPNIVYFFVFISLSDRFLPSLDFILLLDSLSSESAFGHESLDFRSFVTFGSGVLFTFKCSSDGVLFD